MRRSYIGAFFFSYFCEPVMAKIKNDTDIIKQIVLINAESGRRLCLLNGRETQLFFKRIRVEKVFGCSTEDYIQVGLFCLASILKFC